MKKKKIANCLSKSRGAVVAVATTGFVALTSSPGWCLALDLTGVTVDQTDYQTIAKMVIVALVGFWGIKKGLALLGR